VFASNQPTNAETRRVRWAQSTCWIVKGGCTAWLRPRDETRRLTETFENLVRYCRRLRIGAGSSGEVGASRMEGAQMDDIHKLYPSSTGRNVSPAVMRAGLFVLRMVGAALFVLLTICRPIVVIGSKIVALVLAAVWCFCGLLHLAHPGHFPFGMVLVWIAGMCVIAIVYDAVLQLLKPTAQR
jgi:hypothetical protein